MKTIRQIAEEIGVSKQAVYKRYKGKLYTEVLPYVHIKDGTTYIEEQGETVIKQNFSKDSISNEAHTEADTECIQDTPTDTATNILIQMLQKELEVKNKQIEELTATIRIQAESIKADRHNELAETYIDGQQKLTEGKKQGFFKRIFTKKE